MTNKPAAINAAIALPARIPPRDICSSQRILVVIAPTQKVRRGSSAYGYFFFSRRDCAVVVSPCEFECAALVDLCVELHVRIGCNCRIEIHRKHGLAIELAGELVDDFARDRVAILVLPLARLHHVRQQRLDFDHFALFGFCRKLEAWFFRHGLLLFLQLSDQPPQPPIVTFTSLWLVKNSPLLVFATAMMFCD